MGTFLLLYYYMADIPEILDDDSESGHVFTKNKTSNSQKTDSPSSETEIVEELPSNIISDSLSTTFVDEEEEKNNEKKKLITIFAIGFGVFFVSLLVIFSFFRKSEKVNPVTLKFWGLWEEPTIWSDVIADYQKKNPHVTIQYELVSPKQYLNRFYKQTDEGRGPDIFSFHNSWVNVLGNKLSPLPQKVMSQSEFEKTFYSVFKKDLYADKYIRGIPLQLDGLILVYNTKLLKAIGLDSPPADISSFISTAQQLTVYDQSGKIITAGFAAGTSNNVDYYPDIFSWTLALNGITSLKKIDNEKVGNALESYRKFAEEDINVWSEAMPSSVNAFIQEKVAMIMVPSWELLRIKKENPKLDFKTAPLPKLTKSDKTNTSISSYWALGVNATSNEAIQLEAWKFIKFLSDRSSIEKLNKKQSEVRSFAPVSSRIDMKNLYDSNFYLKSVVDQADTYISIPFNAKTHDEGFLNSRLNTYLQNAINESAKGSSYQESAKKLGMGIQEVYTALKIL